MYYWISLIGLKLVFIKKKTLFKTLHSTLSTQASLQKFDLVLIILLFILSQKEKRKMTKN